MSAATPYDLYNHSVMSGSTQSWYSFSGQASSLQNGEFKTIPTLGSMMVIDPSLMNLSELIGIGSLGQYNFQVKLEVYNQYNFTITPELILMITNMGSFTSQLGTSQINTGLIDMGNAMKAREQPLHDFDTTSFHRQIGGVLNRGVKAFSRFYKGQKKSDAHHKDMDIDIDLDSSKGGKMRASKLKRLLNKM
jgi:hypothetical protein